MATKVEPLPPPPLFHPLSSPSLSLLPDDLTVNILARTSISQYRSLSLVSKSLHSLLSSPEIYRVRSTLGNTEPCLYVCLKSPTYHRWLTLEQTLITKDGEIKDELSLAPITLPCSSSSNAPPPSDSTTVAIGSEIYQIGKRSSTVRVFDCKNRTWRHAPNMLVRWKRAKCVSLDGKIYVIGGFGLRVLLDGKIYEVGGFGSRVWGEVFDVRTQTWEPLPIPGDELLDSSLKVVVFGAKLYIFTNLFIYVYDPKEGKWTRTDKWLGYGLHFYQTTLSGPWCVIEDLLVYDYCSKYWCYDLSRKEMVVVKGLEDLYMKRASDYCTIQVVNFDGKLVIMWEERLATTKHGKRKRIWCAVIRLVKRGLEIWGEIERSNVVVLTVPESYELLSCLSVSL